MPTILPLMRHPSDPNIEGAGSRPLTPLVLSSQPQVVYGFDQEDRFEILSAERARMAGGAEDLHGTAVANLCARPASWTPVKCKIGWFRRLRILVWDGDYLAAERILDRAFLRQAHQLLRAPLLAAAIPRRGMLMVTDGAQAEHKLRHFVAMSGAEFLQGDPPSITPQIFAVSDGEVVGHLDDGGLAEALLAAGVGDDHDHDHGDASDDGPYVQSMQIPSSDGLPRTVICIGGASPDVLDQAVRDEVQRIRTARPAGALRVEVLVVPEITPRTDALDRWMADLQRDLPALLTAAAQRSPGAVSVTYGPSTP